jgi:osmotically-inducible protein OsmY
MALTLDRTDAQLRERVLRQLESTRDVDARDVGARAADGVITLVGTVRSFPEKVAAEDAVKRLFGVRRIVNEIAVKSAAPVDDAELQRMAADALQTRAALPPGLIATVRDGMGTLDGTVSWLYQRLAAEVAVAYLPGVCGVANRILMSAAAAPATLRDEVEQALLRTAGLDWKRIRVSTDGGAVQLSGQVFSLIEKEQAERAAWAIPSVTRVDSRLEVTSRRWW